MQTLRLQFIHADDVQHEVQHSQTTLKTLQTVYDKQLEIVVEQAHAANGSTGATSDLLIIVLWNELTPTLEQQLKACFENTDVSKSEVLLFKKNAQVKVDLADREVLMQRIEQKERLELFLNSTLTEHDPILFDTSEEFELRFSEKLEHIISKRLGTPTTPISFRPQLGSTYLERPRLLELLPDSAGYVVWLEAPYGYGKSILAAQWAKQLEADWRIIWLSVDNTNIGNIQNLLAEQFDLSPDIPYEVLLEKLWSEETLLVIEDLTDETDITPILEDVQGLILLASRNSLENNAISKLLTNAKLIHLPSNILAFTENETQQLFLNDETATNVWQQTQGWSLPLHFSFLTGQLPSSDMLVQGIKASLSNEVWHELLFLSALPSLPESAANDFTQELADMNFVQTLEGVYRVHSLVAEQVQKRYSKEQKDAAINYSERLTLLARARLFESIAYYEGFATILEDTNKSLFLSYPEDFIRWHTLAPEPISTVRRTHVTRAQAMTYDFDSVFENLEILLKSDLDKGEQMILIANIIHMLARSERFEEAEDLLDKARAIIPEVSPMMVSVYFNVEGEINLRKLYKTQDASLVPKIRQSYLNGLEQVSLELEHPLAQEYNGVFQGNLANLQADYDLDISGSLDMYLASLESDDSDYNQTITNLNIADIYILLGNYTKSMEHIDLAFSYTMSHYYEVKLHIYKAYIELNSNAFPNLYQEIQRYNYPITSFVAIFWLRTLRRCNDFETLLEVSKKFEDSAMLSIECAYAEAALGNLENAQTRLVKLKTQSLAPIEQCQWHSANFLINKDESSLDAILDLAQEGADLFRYLLITVDALPKNRPELSTPFPIEDILAIGWQEAIEYRMDDVPKLQLRFFGKLEASPVNSVSSVSSLTETLELTDRQKQILALLTLNLSREQIAEVMWPEVDVKKQRNNLNVQLNTLRKVIEPWGVSTYLFEDGLHKISSDYIDLQEALDVGNALQIIGIYQEPFAPGIHLEAIIEERERLRESVIDVLLRSSANEDISTARLFLVKVIELEPLHEEALTSLLKLLIRQGRRREARQRYTKFATQLKDELGLEPLQGTTALIQA